jgi:hypothetical protein
VSASYSLFGLTLQSDVPLPCPEVPYLSEDPHVVLSESTERELAALCCDLPTRIEDDGFWSCALYGDGTARVCWKDHFDFVVSGDGGRVLWRRLVDVPDEVIFTYLLGQVLSFSLLARGLEPMHATSVLVNGSAVAFLGDCGAGKSTLAAILVERGYCLITDDVLVVRFDGDRVIAHSGLGRLKLTPESADAVFLGRRGIPMNRFTQKMVVPLGTDQQMSKPSPLRTAYVIGDRSDNSSVVTSPLTGRAAFVAVIRHTFNDSVRHPARLKQQFAFARRLLETVTVKTLVYPRQLDRLSGVADAILSDLKRNATG